MRRINFDDEFPTTTEERAEIMDVDEKPARRITRSTNLEPPNTQKRAKKRKQPTPARLPLSPAAPTDLSREQEDDDDDPDTISSRLVKRRKQKEITALVPSPKTAPPKVGRDEMIADFESEKSDAWDQR